MFNTKFNSNHNAALRSVWVIGTDRRLSRVWLNAAGITVESTLGPHSIGRFA